MARTDCPHKMALLACEAHERLVEHAQHAVQDWKTKRQKESDEALARQLAE